MRQRGEGTRGTKVRMICQRIWTPERRQGGDNLRPARGREPNSLQREVCQVGALPTDAVRTSVMFIRPKGGDFA